MATNGRADSDAHAETTETSTKAIPVITNKARNLDLSIILECVGITAFARANQRKKTVTDEREAISAANCESRERQKAAC